MLHRPYIILISCNDRLEMALTPTTSAFVATQTQRERINQIRNDISELRLEIKELLPIGQLMIRSIHAEDKIKRMRDQMRTISRAIELLENGNEFHDTQFDSLFNFLQTQVMIGSQNATKIHQKIRMSKMENVGNTGEKIFRSISVHSDLNQEKALPIVSAFVTKTKSLNCAYEEQILLSAETQEMLHAKETEEKLYVDLAGETDSAIDELKARIKQRRKQLDTLANEVRVCEREELQISKDISFRMGKLKRVGYKIKKAAGNDKFLQAIASLINMLQNPTETDEQIRICFDSVVGMARLKANAEQTRQAIPLKPVRKQNIQETLAELKARIEAHKPKL